MEIGGQKQGNNMATEREVHEYTHSNRMKNGKEKKQNKTSSKRPILTFIFFSVQNTMSGL